MIISPFRIVFRKIEDFGGAKSQLHKSRYEQNLSSTLSFM